jgi:hypothetical protein
MNKFLHFNVPLAPSVSNAFRRKWQSRTVSVVSPDAKSVRMLARDFISINLHVISDIKTKLNVGVTFLSFADRYCKKTGREEATKRMAEVELKVVGVTSNKTHTFVHLEPYKGIGLTLRTSKESDFTTVVGELVGGQ